MGIDEILKRRALEVHVALEKLDYRDSLCPGLVICQLLRRRVASFRHLVAEAFGGRDCLYKLLADKATQKCKIRRIPRAEPIPNHPVFDIATISERDYNPTIGLTDLKCLLQEAWIPQKEIELREFGASFQGIGARRERVD